MNTLETIEWREPKLTIEIDKGGSWKLLVTSRSGITDIERNLEADALLEIRSHDSDVRHYLQGKLRDQQYMSEWISASPDFEVAIIEAILPRLSGMFLLARVYVDFLANIPTKRGVRKALVTLPKGIQDTYAEAWDRICAQKPQQAELGKIILAWILCASRPLQVQELRHALAIVEGDEELDPEGLLENESLTSFCAGLVIIDEQNGVMSLIHPTTHEYFSERKETLFSTAHEMIAIACTNYLLMYPFRSQGACPTATQLDERHRQNPLLDYAAVNWGLHVRLSQSEKSLRLSMCLLWHERSRSAAIQALVQNTSGSSVNGTEWLQCSGIASEQTFSKSLAFAGALHLAAYFGLIGLAEKILEDETGLNDPDGMGGTAVHWAILGGQNEMLKFLLESGAPANASGGPFSLRRWSGSSLNLSSPLQFAAFSGNETAIEHLVRHNADINRLPQPFGKSRCNARALTVALLHEQFISVENLLLLGADVNLSIGRVLYTTVSGNLETLKKMIEAGLSGLRIQQAIAYAAFNCRYDQLALLLQAGGHVDGLHAMGESTKEAPHLSNQQEAEPWNTRLASPEDKLGLSTFVTPLVAVITTCKKPPVKNEDIARRCFDLLIIAGADLDIVSSRTYTYGDDWASDDCDGRQGCWRGRRTTPLITAACLGQTELVISLVENGANINCSLEEHNTVLASVLHIEGHIISILESSGFEIPSRTILSGLSSLDVRAMVRLLVDLGADPDLCTPADKARVTTILSMSIEDCHNMTTLQELVHTLRISKWHGKSWHQRRINLEYLI